jgi:hypothetical protein
MIDESKLPPLEVRPYDISEGEGGRLYVRMHRDFDRIEHAWNWARDIVAACKGPYEEILLDVGACTRISSMFFAGLLMLRDSFKPVPVALTNVSQRIYHTLQVMCMDNLFRIELSGQGDAG